MKQVRTAFSLLGLGVLLASTAVAQTFTAYNNFPEPAPGSFGVAGAALPDGRLLIWNGQTVFRQFGPNVDSFQPVAAGYPGDPGFVAVSPDGTFAILGAGFNNTASTDLGTNGELYKLDLDTFPDFTPNSVVASQSHFDGAFLEPGLLLVDAGRLDFSGSDLITIDISGSKALLGGVVVRKPAGTALPKSVVVEKPPLSFASSVTVDNAEGVVYAMDANTRELRRFDVSDLINAHQTGTMLDWSADGTLIGSPGDYFSGGVSGIKPAGTLVIGGSEGFGLPGGIQLVDPSNGNVDATLDPTGMQDFTQVIYNEVTDTITALAGGQVFADVMALPGTPAAGTGVITLGALLMAGLGAGILRRR